MRCWFVVVVAVVLGCMAGRVGHAAEGQVVWTYDAEGLHRLDLTGQTNARAVWDTMHLLGALQGLVNRDGPKFYLFCCRQFGVDTDRFWLNWLREEDGWMSKAEIRSLPDLDAVLAQFRDSFEGLVVYDPNVPATAALASTVAGVERLLPVRHDPAPGSLYSRMRNVPVKVWLVERNGDSRFKGKVGAYRWAVDNYLKADRCGEGVAAYYVDAFWLNRPGQAQPDMHTLSNHDWFVARRAFFFDLSPWGDEAPVDDPSQALGTDKRVLLEILGLLHRNAGSGIVRIGGFPPWPFKYTTHGQAGRHEGVPTEWEFTRLISQFNAFKEADAAGVGAMANASFFQHYPLKERHAQPNRKPGLADWKARGWVSGAGDVAPRLFVAHYVGDYDSPSWLYKAVPAFFNDPKRGEVPLAWAFDPNLADRAPQALVYAYRNASTNDFFISGNSGAGYLNPRGLTDRPDSGLPSGLKQWQEHCERYFARWDMTITGFVLDGSSGASTAREYEAYRTFSPDGLGTHFDGGPKMHAGIPACPEQDLPDSSEAAARVIAERARKLDGAPGFLWARSILKTPSWYSDVSRLLREKHPDVQVEVVDPYSFFGLIKQHLGASE